MDHRPLANNKLFPKREKKGMMTMGTTNRKQRTIKKNGTRSDVHEIQVRPDVFLRVHTLCVYFVQLRFYGCMYMHCASCAHHHHHLLPLEISYQFLPYAVGVAIFPTLFDFGSCRYIMFCDFHGLACQ